MDARTQAFINELARQRNEALNLCANLKGELAVLQAKIAELEGRVQAQ